MGMMGYWGAGSQGEAFSNQDKISVVMKWAVGIKVVWPAELWHRLTNLVSLGQHG